ncbi:cell division ATP-binding protein FtsE [Thermus igniterrae]|uniref:cell division ATP-binding protein FtsE n=1 Tax=Thermus igniterrae TaxID=88189 RepID=UPI000360DDCE|nr:cell division ATP-binding protein FtsE [Thermus igniterrae]
MIAFHRVGLEYPRTGTKALYNVSLEVKKGEFVYVVGHSGAGKSTLLALILRRLLPTQGAVYFAGQNLKALRGDQVALHRRRIGMVFQDHRLLSDLTVEENLAFVLEVQGVPRKEWPERIATALRRVGLAHKKRAFPEELSVGEAQRVAIARALLLDPPVILADEPTGNLDLENALQVLDILKAAHSRGATVVVATHSRELLEAYPARVVVLKAGQVVRDERPGEGGSIRVRESPDRGGKEGT